MQKTKLEIIDETVAFYGEDPTRRSITPKRGCRYLNETTGNMCAVGRCLTKGGLDFVHGYEGYGIMFFPDKKSSNDINDLFKNEYKGHSIEFWDNLQTLHDRDGYWNVGKGLTKLGKEYVNSLKIKYA
jgi:hypothetical protein